MRIGIDWRSAYAPRGGIPSYVRNLAAALRRRFPEDSLLLYGHRLRGRRPSGPPAGAVLHAAPLPSRVVEVLGRLGFGADRVLGGCDVLHLTDYAWLRPTRAALVATVHDVLFEELPRCYTPPMREGLRRTTRRLVRHADRLVVPSVRTKVALVERFGARPDRVDVVPLAPRALPDVPPARSDRPYVLSVGTLEPRKNHLRLLAAHVGAVRRGLDLDLVLVGARGWLDDDVVRALASSPRVRWEEDADDARLAALYRGAVALAYPSLGEGFGLPVAEALALGVPVLTSAGTACAEVAGDAALLVDPYDVEALADALLRLAEDEALRRALVLRGRARASAWTWDRAAEATRQAYARAARPCG